MTRATHYERMKVADKLKILLFLTNKNTDFKAKLEHVAVLLYSTLHCPTTAIFQPRLAVILKCHSQNNFLTS